MLETPRRLLRNNDFDDEGEEEDDYEEEVSEQRKLNWYCAKHQWMDGEILRQTLTYWCASGITHDMVSVQVQDDQKSVRLETVMPGVILDPASMFAPYIDLNGNQIYGPGTTNYQAFSAATKRTMEEGKQYGEQVEQLDFECETQLYDDGFLPPIEIMDYENGENNPKVRIMKIQLQARKKRAKKATASTVYDATEIMNRLRISNSNDSRRYSASSWAGSSPGKTSPYASPSPQFSPFRHTTMPPKHPSNPFPKPKPSPPISLLKRNSPNQLPNGKPFAVKTNSQSIPQITPINSNRNQLNFQFNPNLQNSIPTPTPITRKKTQKKRIKPTRSSSSTTTLGHKNIPPSNSIFEKSDIVRPYTNEELAAATIIMENEKLLSEKTGAAALVYDEGSSIQSLGTLMSESSVKLDEHYCNSEDFEDEEYDG